MKWIRFLLFNLFEYSISLVIVLVNLFWLNFVGVNELLIVSIVYFLTLHTIIKIYEGYKLGIYKVSEIVYSVSLATIICNVILALGIFIFKQKMIVFVYLLIAQIIEIILIILWGILGNKFYFMLFNHHNILLIYGNDPTEVSKKIVSRKNRYIITKMISDKLEKSKIVKIADNYDSIMLYEVEKSLRDIITVFCFETGKSLFLVPEIPEIIRKGTHNLYLMDTPLLAANHWGLSLGQKLIKRIMDLVIIIPIFFIAIPFMILTALCIKIYDGGPVIYKQERLTTYGRKFDVYKFRSMIVNAEANGAQLSTENDDRITPVGKIIRAIRFDELPQIFNILKGDMSIVGPRPERPEIANEYYQELPEFKLRLKVKAGLTGYAQVFGKYNTSPKDKLKLDLMYINDYSIWLDMKLIIYTIKILFLKSSTEGIDDNKKTAI